MNDQEIVILATRLNAFATRRAQAGCAAICSGSGEAAAMVIERLG